MNLGDYRTLVVLRHAAESVDEVIVFLARQLQLQLKFQKQAVADRIVIYCGGIVFATTTAFTVGGEFLWPAVALGLVLIAMGVQAICHLRSVERQRRELAFDQMSVEEFLRRASRNRLQNAVAISIQNRMAATRLSKQHDLDDKERGFMARSEAFWTNRLRDLKSEIDQLDPAIWKGHENKKHELDEWIATEEKEFSITKTNGDDARPT